MSKLSDRRRRPIVVLAAALVAMLAAPLTAQDRAADREAALQAVRKEIDALQRRTARQTAQRDDGARALRAVEVEIAAATRKLEGLRRDQAAQQARQRTLAQDRQRADRRLDAERATLARQVRMSYMTGREELFKLLLSQETPASMGRMLVYYDYLNRARSSRIGVVSTELQTLQRLSTESEEIGRSLAALEEAQRNEVAELDRARGERRDLVARLDADIGGANQEIERLRAEERRLAELVKELGALLAGFPVDSDEPFARLKGKLAWPVQGRIAADYGKPRNGGPMRWNGVLLEAAQGTAVRAVYHGRVAFADWLAGLGMLIIVDHGNGYMSLYGHNEALLKESGDWVEPGEVIAQVGDTGGQARPSLYFEIRQNGEPVNPHQWVAQRPAR